MMKLFETNYWPIFEDNSSLTIMAMEDFHDYSMMILTMITMFLFVIMFGLIFSSFKNIFMMEGQLLELIWTVMPMIILIFIAYPSLFYLYFSDLSISPSMTIKVIGAQWYWIYEYSDLQDLNFSSYLLNDNDLISMKESSIYKLGWRLLECDNQAILPFNLEVRFMITSQDVIHSFSIPGLSLKVDAVPGRLNSITIFNKRPGQYYGQCSEICGVGHAFMPISMEFINSKDFMSLIRNLNN